MVLGVRAGGSVYIDTVEPHHHHVFIAGPFPAFITLPFNAPFFCVWKVFSFFPGVCVLSGVSRQRGAETFAPTFAAACHV